MNNIKQRYYTAQEAFSQHQTTDNLDAYVQAAILAWQVAEIGDDDLAKDLVTIASWLFQD
jgi:hypothetical protein